ncbi:MAG: cell division ATP-binding protein FtsE [Hydrogenophilales bacterium CG03_land_8_20_14_0_80_62_28]|nr:cell division ATP-binding protein FtsE [Betaproteobacteria bacterium]OIO79462.1 MAG: cell division ATP-binding protein FtsE [Hydrogenophilaceae bacterium CG1_02_62_390]PIV24114.1 MAG: cell division ATP-binding protein FtsE [Hydrogenophilales bacterium CG03_land_8_20_14_0_80_62_28]PIW37472.1 MAG: cell division ATP-binding protein FtsE [Hydrogenophilales bacterium CG15_BIG_FIL_POST_REV_8_21_14_020_62_31]PIW71525.1 MAG: cell division ATP-binding protein FtsE [Hydrogenophilales bacterium CG12_bi
MIEFSDVVKRYPGGHEALSGVNLTITRGEMVFLTGHSGAGKSTLLKLIAAIERPTSGIITVSGQNLSRIRRSALPYFRRNIGLIFQDHKLLYDRSVYDNVLLPLHIQGMTGHDAGKRVRAALDKVGLLNKERARPITLSGGEQQRLCIARAIVSRPPLLLADEPTANLDEDYARDLMDMFKAFNQVGVTVILASHNQDMIRRYGGRTIALANGRVAP